MSFSTKTTSGGARSAIEILVVEDSAIQAELLRRTLTLHGYTVHLAHHGAQALEIVRQRPPTLILSDIAMPVMDGYAMCHAIKSDPTLQHIPIILLTALSDPEDIIRGLNAKADNYLTKPYDDTTLLARIEHLLANQALRRDAKIQLGVELFFSGKKHVINSDRRQILDLLISTFEDAVQQNRQLMKRTQALQASEESYRALIENTFSGFYRATSDGQFLEVNPAYVTMLGYESKGELLPVAIPTTLYDSPADYEAFRARLLAEGGMKEHTGRLRKKDGSEIILAMNVRVVKDPDGRVRYFEGFVSDITERKRGEIALQQAKDAAEAANQAKSRFLANMSHDIRTPMNGILGMVELILETDLTAEQREHLTLVKASANSLLRLLDDILDFAKIEARKLSIEPLEFRLRDSIGSTLKALAVRAHTKGLELVCRIAPSVPDALVGDPARLRQILVNLVGNAIKFTERGEVVVEVEEVSSEVSPRQASPNDTVRLHFAVRDTGVGISIDKQGTIFEPFVQADSSTTRHYGGTGLGLAISAELVALMGGRIWVESAPGRGSAFHFTLELRRQGDRNVGLIPFDPSQVPRPAAATVDSEPSHRAPPATDLLQSRLHILLAEDNMVNQKLAVHLLERRGHTVVVASTGGEVLSAWRREAFDLILMDVQMPEMDGLEATAAIRAEERRSGHHIPIIAMTAHAMAGDRQRCLEAGMDEYISKPIQVDIVFETIARVSAATRLT